MEYALKYQNNLKGLIISNMMASVPAYKYAEEVLGPQLDPKVFAD
jgi:proline iminopeptidase